MKRHDSGFWKSIGLSALFLCALLLSCGEKETLAPIQPGEEIFISSAHKGDVPIGEVFSEWRYVSLETTDEALMMDWERTCGISVSKDSLIYIQDSYKVMRFRPDGQVDYVYNKRGDGPESYDYLKGFTLWENGDISVIDVGTRSVISYANDGRFISRLSLKDWNLRNVISIDDSLMLVQIAEERVGVYTYHIYNRYTRREVNAYNLVKVVNQMPFFLSNFLYRYDGRIFWHGYQTNNIYDVTPDTSIVRYTINVDNRMPPEDFWWRQEGKNSMRLIQEYENKGYIGHIPYYVESDRSILLYYEGGNAEDRAYAFVDKSARATRVIRKFIFEDGFVFKPPILYSLEDGWCAFLLYPEDILLNAAFAQRFPGLEEESNPVLFLAKIK